MSDEKALKDAVLAVIGVAVGMGIISIIVYFFAPAWGMCGLGFGIFLTVVSFFATYSTAKKRHHYLSSGVKNFYIPLFEYEHGLDPKARPGIGDHSIALVSDTEFIFCYCEPKLCRKYPVADFWDDVNKEFARIHKKQFRGAFVIAPNQDELREAKVQAFIKNTAFNQTIGKVIGRKMKTTFVDAQIFVLYESGGQTKAATFNITGKTGGVGTMDFLEMAKPDAELFGKSVADFFDNLFLAEEVRSLGWELFEIHDTDTAAVKSAKRVALELIKQAKL